MFIGLCTSNNPKIADNDINMDIKFGEAYPINVFTHPFNFSNPEFLISEGVNG